MLMIVQIGKGTMEIKLRLYEWLSNAQGWALVFDVLRLFPDNGCAYPMVDGVYGMCDGFCYLQSELFSMQTNWNLMPGSGLTS
jgi:hypothetical protein